MNLLVNRILDKRKRTLAEKVEPNSLGINKRISTESENLVK